MNALKQINFTVVNIDLITTKDKKEFIKMQGLIPLNDKEKENVLTGDFKTLEIFDEFCNEYEEICGNAKKVNTIVFEGYFENFKFKPVNIVKVITK